MSVVAWDGTTLAADKQVTYGDMACLGKKLFLSDDGLTVMAKVGDSAHGAVMMEWYTEVMAARSAGLEEPEFPKIESYADSFTILIVATPEGAMYFEQTGMGYPIRVYQGNMAWGSGREFAMGAMVMGASAIDAVGVAIDLDIHCGKGVEAYDLVDGIFEKTA